MAPKEPLGAMAPKEPLGAMATKTTNKEIKLEKFLQCMSLERGVLIIACFGLVYGFIGIFFFFSMCIRYSEWQQQYKDKLDLYVYLYFVFFSIISLFVCGIFLFWGLATDEDIPFIVGISCIIVHLSILGIALLGMFIYCLIFPSCFQKQGPEYVIVLSLITALYSVPWGYAIWVIDTYRNSI